jgi:hypothetical protein
MGNEAKSQELEQDEEEDEQGEMSVDWDGDD